MCPSGLTFRCEVLCQPESAAQSKMSTMSTSSDGYRVMTGLKRYTRLNVLCLGLILGNLQAEPYDMPSNVTLTVRQAAGTG